MGLLSVKNFTGSFSSTSKKKESVSATSTPPVSPSSSSVSSASSVSLSSPAPTQTPSPSTPPPSSFKVKKKDKRRTDVQHHVDELLVTAIMTSSLEVVQFLLAHGAAPPNGARTDKDTDARLLERGHAWVDIIDLAATSETPDAAAKADYLIRKSGYNGHVPSEWVDYAIRNDKIGALRAILQPPGGKTTTYYRPNHATCEHLHVAVDTPTPNLAIVQLLLDMHLEDVNRVPKKDNLPYAGEAPLHVATRQGCPAAVSLLRKYGANVDLRGKNYRRTVSSQLMCRVLLFTVAAGDSD